MIIPNLYQLLTHSMEHSPWEANRFSASQESLWNPEIHYCIQMCLQPVSLYQFHSLFWAYHSWGIKQGLGIVTCNTENLEMTGLVCVFIDVLSFLQHFISEWLTVPNFTSCTPFTHVPYVPESHMGLRNIRHMCEQSTNSESGAVICHAKCIIPSFLNFFQFGENIHWIIDGFALGTMCARCVDIDHFCAKAPWA